MSDPLPSAGPEPMPATEVFIRSWWRRLLAATILLPLACLGVSVFVGRHIGPEWQSGSWSEMLQLAFRAGVWAWLSPLMLFAIVSAARCLRSPEYPIPAWTRCGLWAGVFVALPFALLTTGLLATLVTTRIDWRVMSMAALCGAWIVGVPVAMEVIRRNAPRFPRRLREWAGVGLGLAIAALFALAAFTKIGKVLVGTSITLTLLATPVWCAAAYGALAWKTGSVSPWPPTVAGSLSAAGWAAAVLAAIRTYNALPTQPPHCFVATAAANGHPRLVGRLPPSQVRAGHAVTAQLQWLKAGELALRALAPAAHAWIRRTYDRLGPALARRLRTPWLADLAWLALKPAEWLARGLLRALAPGIASEVKALYRT